MASSVRLESTWEDSDSDKMRRLRARKRQLEEAEVYNAPATLRKKRRAVREQAKLTSTTSASTELEFDDAVTEQNYPSDPTPDPSSQIEPATKVTVQEARRARRIRAAQRRRDGEVKGVDDASGEKGSTPKGTRRKFRLRDAQKMGAAAGGEETPATRSK
ncbi:Hypothetical predicted protein [Lecanosticta acicola]|uniref:Uncharacterized protein n=1 Tax=Lecanosticta acicola TaxID=111012 RepID=A0AAI8YYT8_9PEZI|nr:Hypothetical predicted protein [Lecanosticta acicola]